MPNCYEKKTKTKIKTISHDLFSYASLRQQNSGHVVYKRRDTACI